jgi:SAM-dependent methyltransferase
MAVPLTKYLDENGSYEGFDLYTKGISWSQKNITSKYPNFRFQLVDIYNQFYNPQGKYRAAEFKFPYKDKSFDFIFLTSVFTHMLPADLENYLSEVKRVLKDTGRCFITFFLLNPESMKFIHNRRSAINFAFDKGEYRVYREEQPEHAVAYKEEFIKGLFHKYNLVIKEPIHYGSWSGRKDYLSFQDIVILKHNGF